MNSIDYQTLMDDETGWITAYATPLMRLHQKMIDSPYLYDKLISKGGYDYTNTYVYKVSTKVRKDVKETYQNAVRSVHNPAWCDVIMDNAVPLLILNPIQRVITYAQAFPTLTSRFFAGNTYSQLLANITYKGFFTGLFRGSIPSVVHFSGTLFPAMYVANKNPETKLSSFLSTYYIGQLLFYPIDTFRTILYADAFKCIKLTDLARISPRDLYRGFLEKSVANLPLLLALYAYSEEKSKEFYYSLLFAGLAFPLSTIAVRKQLSATSISTYESGRATASLTRFRGVVPFLLVAGLAGFNVSPMYSEKRLNSMAVESDNELRRRREPAARFN